MLLRILITLGLSSVVFAQTETAPSSQPEYAGPSVLSRGLGASILARQQSVRFRPYLGISGFCDSGLTSLTVGVGGKPPNQLACGVDGQLGLNGYHIWRKSQLGIQYTGDYHHYARYSNYDGIDQLLSLGYTLRTTKRTQLTLKESAGTFSRNYVQPTAYGFYDANALPVPDSVPFDNRIYYAQSAADFTFRPTARLSFNMGGNFDAVRYRASSLYGSTVETGRADVIYRYNRFGSIGASYEFSHMRFKNVFGSSDLHDLSIVWSARLSRSWELRLRAGATRVETLAFQVVAVDPFIAAITGQTAAIRATYRLNYVPSGGASLSKSFQHASLTFNYDRGVTPGNGVFITSSQETGRASYSYVGIRRWTFSTSLGYERYTALVQTINQYKSYEAGAGVGRELGKGVGLSIRFDERRYDTGFGNFRRDAYRAMLGFTWSPGDVPLMLW